MRSPESINCDGSGWEFRWFCDRSGIQLYWNRGNWKRTEYGLVTGDGTRKVLLKYGERIYNWSPGGTAYSDCDWISLGLGTIWIRIKKDNSLWNKKNYEIKEKCIEMFLENSSKVTLVIDITNWKGPINKPLMVWD